MDTAASRAEYGARLMSESRESVLSERAIILASRARGTISSLLLGSRDNWEPEENDL